MTENDILAIALECGATFECETLCVNGKDAHDLLITFARRIQAAEREWSRTMSDKKCDCPCCLAGQPSPT